MQNAGRRERASSSVEWVGLGVAVAVLLVALGRGFGEHGTRVGTAVGAHLVGAVAGRVGPPPRPAVHEPRFRRADVVHDSRRGARERRWDVGTKPPRVSQSDLHFDPLVPTWSRWEASGRDVRTAGGARVDVRASACALCVDAGWRDSVKIGVVRSHTGGTSSTRPGGVELELQGRVAVLASEVLAHAQRSWGGAHADVRARGRATLGADADARIAVRGGRDAAEVDARAGAMAGAAVRGEARAGLTLLGVALTANGRAEGWAGAGARGRATAKIGRGTLTWNLGAGAALGLGGAAEWGGSIDVSKLPERHRAVARRTLAQAVVLIAPTFWGGQPSWYARSRPRRGDDR